MYPERRLYLASGVTETMVANQSTPLRDLYIVYAGRSPDTGKPVIHAYLNPLVKWIWFGGIVVVLGTGLAMLPNRRAALVLRPVTEKSWGDAAVESGHTAESPSCGDRMLMISRIVKKSLSGAWRFRSLFAGLLAYSSASLRAQETARAKELGQKLMCVCGCNQLLGSCNHVGCTYSGTDDQGTRPGRCAQRVR